MPNFFKSFFSGKSEDPENEKQKTAKKNFEIFKYDGLRAQRMGRPDYAIKCFTEALAIEEDFETLSYLSQLYVQLTELDKAREIQRTGRGTQTAGTYDRNRAGTYLHLPQSSQRMLHAGRL